MIKRANFARQSTAKRWAIVVCFLLVGIAVAAQTFHLHSNDLANDAKHCTICQVAHAPVQIASTVHVGFGLATAAFFIFSSDPDPKPVFASFCLFSRPPPVA